MWQIRLLDGALAPVIDVPGVNVRFPDESFDGLLVCIVYRGNGGEVFSATHSDGLIARISAPGEECTRPCISGDGSAVAYEVRGGGATRAVVRSTSTGEIIRVIQGALYPCLSDMGDALIFTREPSNEASCEVGILYKMTLADGISVPLTRKHTADCQEGRR